MLDKLEREYTRLLTSQKREDAIDHAINFCITSWQLMDWVWRWAGQNQSCADRIYLETNIMYSEKNKKTFKDWVRSNKEIGYCEAIATYSKHFEAKSVIEKNLATAAITSGHEWNSAQPYAHKWDENFELFIIDEKKKIHAQPEFSAALAFWTHFIMKNCPRKEDQDAAIALNALERNS